MSPETVPSSPCFVFFDGPPLTHQVSWPFCQSRVQLQGQKDLARLLCFLRDSAGLVGVQPIVPEGFLMHGQHLKEPGGFVTMGPLKNAVILPQHPTYTNLKFGSYGTREFIESVKTAEEKQGCSTTL